MNFIGRISGVVTYTDGSNDTFAAHLDNLGNIVTNDLPYSSSNRAVLELQSDEDWLENLLNILNDDLILTPDGIASASKIVSDAVIHITGRVARNDNSWEDFAVQFDSENGGRILPTSDSTSVFNEYTESLVKSWFGSILIGGENSVDFGDPGYLPSLDFSDSRNSMYISILIEEF